MRERDWEVIRGRSRRMRRPVGEESMALRRRVMKYGVAVVSPRVAIRSVCVFQSHPVGGVSFVIYNLSVFVVFVFLGPTQTHTSSSGAEEGY